MRIAIACRVALTRSDNLRNSLARSQFNLKYISLFLPLSSRNLTEFPDAEIPAYVLLYALCICFRSRPNAPLRPDDRDSKIHISDMYMSQNCEYQRRR